MSIQDRIKISKKLEKLRESRIISYFLGTKQNMATKMGLDTIPLIYDHLRSLKKCNIPFTLCIIKLTKDDISE